jgi:hypothetical protein
MNQYVTPYFVEINIKSKEVTEIIRTAALVLLLKWKYACVKIDSVLYDWLIATYKLGKIMLNTKTDFTSKET